jgi:hypothetical protein
LIAPARSPKSALSIEGDNLVLPAISKLQT